jgi:hypothetical protein
MRRIGVRVQVFSTRAGQTRILFLLPMTIPMLMTLLLKTLTTSKSSKSLHALHFMFIYILAHLPSQNLQEQVSSLVEKLLRNSVIVSSKNFSGSYLLFLSNFYPKVKLIIFTKTNFVLLHYVRSVFFICDFHLWQITDLLQSIFASLLSQRPQVPGYHQCITVKIPLFSLSLVTLQDTATKVP